MENKGAAAAVPEKEATTATAPSSSCFKRTVGEDAGWVDLAKDQYRQFTEAPVTEHWTCIKNKVSSLLGEPIFGGFKGDSSSSTPPSIKSQ